MSLFQSKNVKSSSKSGNKSRKLSIESLESRELLSTSPISLPSDLEATTEQTATFSLETTANADVPAGYNVNDWNKFTAAGLSASQVTWTQIGNERRLTAVDCSYGSLTSLDLSGCTALKTLSCFNNQLNTLNVSGCTALEFLHCEGNQLTSLDVSQNTALTQLLCDSNQLTALDVSKNTALTELRCDYNQLKSLDVSKNIVLKALDCSANQLTTLDVSKNTVLTGLLCDFNQLTTLDVSKNTALTDLSCAFNRLATLNVSTNTALKTLDCSSNQLTALDVSKNTALIQVYCSSNQLAALNVSKNIALTHLSCSSNQLTALDVSKNIALTNLSCYSNRLTALNLFGTPLANFTAATKTEYATYFAFSYTSPSRYLYVDKAVTLLNLGAPQITATGVAGGVKLSWNAIAGADRYVVWRRNETNTAWIELGTFTETTFTDTGARPLVAETFAVRAFLGECQSDYTAVKGTALLGVPQFTTTSILGGVKLTWPAIMGADRYVIWRRNEANTAWIELATVTGATFTDTMGRVGVAESYGVRAFLGEEKSGFITVKGTAGPATLSVPQVTATGIAGGVKLTWTAVAGADRYGVWRQAADGKGWIEFGDVTATTFTDTTGRVNVAETYAVRAFLGTEKSSYHAVKGTALLNVPQVTTKSVLGGVKLSWDAIAEADRYFAWRRNETDTAWIELGSFTGTTFTDTTARVGVAETYAVRAYQGTKESSYRLVKGTAFPATLGVPQVTATGIAGGVKLSWDAIAGADRYGVWRLAADGKGWVEFGDVTETTFTDTTGRVNVAETYAVRAFFEAEKSSYHAVKGTALLNVPQVTTTSVLGGVKLSWDAIDGADRYFAWRRNETDTAWIELGSFTGTTFTDTTGRVGVAETYAVRAYQGTKESSYRLVKGTALPATLGVPQVKATGVLGGVTLTWDAIAGADRYGVWRQAADGKGWVEFGYVTETTFTDTTGRDGVAEIYAVRAFLGEDKSSYQTVKGTRLAVANAFFDLADAEIDALFLQPIV